MGLAWVGWRDGEKMQTIVTELKKKVAIKGGGALVWENLRKRDLIGGHKDKPGKAKEEFG